MTGALWRVAVDGTARWAAGESEAGPEALLAEDVRLDRLLRGPAEALAAVLDAPVAAVPDDVRILAPLESQEVWAAGVTYLRSREARKEESGSPDHYDAVYDAERPELFFKAAPGRARGPGERVGIRADSGWDVPEPELAVLLNAAGEVVALTVGNDVSSRSIEGANPLYLPQAKVYDGSCAVGPCLVPVAAAPTLAGMTIRLAVRRGESTVYRDTVAVAQLRRPPDELARWLYRSASFPVGVLLLTGTAIVPHREFTLHEGDEVEIAITGLGALRNTVEVVGAPRGDEPG